MKDADEAAAATAALTDKSMQVLSFPSAYIETQNPMTPSLFNTGG